MLASPICRRMTAYWALPRRVDASPAIGAGRRAPMRKNAQPVLSRHLGDRRPNGVRALIPRRTVSRAPARFRNSSMFSAAPPGRPQKISCHIRRRRRRGTLYVRYRTENSAGGHHTSSCRFRSKSKNSAEQSGAAMKRTGTHLNPVDPAREKVKGECSASARALLRAATLTLFQSCAD